MTRAHHYAGELLPTDPGLRFSFGLPGMGKTYGTRAQVYAALRDSPIVIVALDATAEWSSVPRDLAPVTAGACDLDTASRRANEGARLIIVRPPDDLDGDGDADTSDTPRETLEAACRWARQWARRMKPRSPGRHALAGVVAPEAHRAAPVRYHELPRHTSAAATAWRHERVSIWLDSQRPQQVSTTLRDLARVTRYYALGDSAGATGLPRALIEATEECGRRFDLGQPGWHVRVGTVPRTPYVITRATV